jgi:hypothetical protein
LLAVLLAAGLAQRRGRVVGCAGARGRASIFMTDSLPI